MSHDKNANQAQWDDRYSAHTFAYGEQPNDFLKSVAPRFAAGSRILSLAEGDGRNGVYLASLGHLVTGVDISPVGLENAQALARTRGASITTIVADLATYEIVEDSWDAIISVWCHTPRATRQRLHRACVSGLKSGGLFCLEAYTPEQLQYQTGGPKDVEYLMTLEALRSELLDLDFIIEKEILRDIHEGPFHTGMSAVVQVLAQKR